MDLLLIFKKRFLKPSVLKRKVVCGEKKPRNLKEENAAVLELPWDKDVICKALSKEFEKWSVAEKRSEKTLILINLNTADPYPASTNPQTLEIVIDELKKSGMKKIFIGACSSNSKLPTKQVLKRTPIYEKIRSKAEFLLFDRLKWVTVKVNGVFLKEVTVPSCIYDMDRIIYLANHKCHELADFSFGMKLAVGLIHPLERIKFHKEYLCEKVVETALAVSPDMTLIDANLSMITGGPAEGKVVEAGRFFIGHSPAEADLKAYRLMYDLKKKNNEIGVFYQDPFKMKQFAHAQRINLLKRGTDI